MTAADQLRQRASEIEGHAHTVRYTNPTDARALNRIAAEMRDIAAHLPPERTEQ